MTIHTRMGREVTIVGRDSNWADDPCHWLLVETEGGEERWRRLDQLRAEGGLDEILVAVEAAPSVVWVGQG
jgi:hypothetical protein